MNAQPKMSIEIPRAWGEKLLRGEMTLGQFVGLSPEVLYQMADVAYRLFNSGRLQQARRMYRGLVAASPFDPLFHCHLGATLFRMGEHQLAHKAYCRALQLNPNDVDALAGRGELCLELGRREEAIADLRAAVEADPELAHLSAIRANAKLRVIEGAEARSAS